MTNDSDALLTEAELAQYLKLSLSTVRRMRYAGTGPAVVWLGARPRYRKSDVDAWLAAGGSRGKGKQGAP
jgi:excisionase family DNA binding protein